MAFFVLHLCVFTNLLFILEYALQTIRSTYRGECECRNQERRKQFHFQLICECFKTNTVYISDNSQCIYIDFVALLFLSKNYYFCFVVVILFERFCSSAKDLMCLVFIECQMIKMLLKHSISSIMIHQIMIISIQNSRIISISGPLNIEFLLTSAVQNLILNQSLFVFNCFQGLMHSR